MGLLDAEQGVENINKCTFRDSGTPGRRTRRRKSQKMHFQEFWAPVRRTKHRRSQNMHFQECWASCAQNKTSEMLTDELSELFNCSAQSEPQTESPEPWAKTPNCLTASWWSDGMKYRASLPHFFSDSLPREFRASGTLSKFCVVRKYEIQGVTLAIFSDSLPCGFSVSGTLPKFCVVRRYEIQGVTLAIFSDSLRAKRPSG